MSWLRGKSKVKSNEPIKVVMYTRSGCHLCDEAWKLLEEMSRSYPLQLDSIDIDGDPDLVSRHGERVPVVLVQGKERFWGRINRALVERLLRSLSS